MNKGKYYITTAIAYTSGTPHIGNSYEIVLADSIARFKRKDGYDVFFQTGTDEHGQKIELKAEETGVTPQAYVDKVAGEIRRICDSLDTSYDKLSAPPMISTRNRCRRSLRSFTSRGISIRGPMKGFTVPPASPSGQSPSLWTENAPTAAGR